VSWESSPSPGVFKADKSAFLFSLNNNKKYPVTDSTKAILNHSGAGPCFGGGCDLAINDNADTSGGWNYPRSYPIKENGKRVLTENDEKDFKCAEIEVYQIAY
jgi:hypothetical protein